MKNFEAPVVKIEKFEVADVIATSTKDNWDTPDL